VLPDTFVQTRLGLHAVAEHVLAAARYGATGRIGLQVTDSGFATQPFGAGPAAVGVRDALLWVRDDSGERSAPLTTLRAAGEFVGIEPGAPANVYAPATSCELDAPLGIDPAAARTICAWYRTISEALRMFAAQAPQTLWPEHFDLAIRVDGTNFGGLAGDRAMPEPYGYVGPASVPAGDAFFDHPFGASRTWLQAATTADLLTFFREGAQQAARLAAASA
jgi:hypothetical protein